MFARDVTVSYSQGPDLDLEYNSRFRYFAGEHPKSDQRPAIVALPGGPALSSATLEPLSSMKSVSDVYLLDPAGTGHTRPIAKNDYESVLADIEKAILALGRDVILIGHSFGSVQAADLVTRHVVPVVGAVFLGGFLSENTVTNLEARLRNLIASNPEVETCFEGIFADPNNRGHLQKYWELAQDYYFSPEAVQAGLLKFIQEDECCQLLYGAWNGGLQRVKSGLLDDLKDEAVPMLALGAWQDGIISFGDLLADAAAAGIDADVIEEANHFMMFEQPKAVDAILKRFFKSKLALSES